VFVAGVRPPTRGAPEEKGTAIMKLTTMTQVTVDGVMQGNGGATDEDRRNGFERGGWAMGKGDDETRTFITRTYQRADAFLFGRRTYELYAGSWGAIEQMRAQPIGVALNETPKYVASTTLTAPRWADTTVLSGDLAAAIDELKAKPAGERHDPGLPAGRPPAVCNRLRHVTSPTHRRPTTTD
jgi:dihydrofolate reductase